MRTQTVRQPNCGIFTTHPAHPMHSRLRCAGGLPPAATSEAWDDRNRIARECADLRDQRDDLAREIAALKDHIEIIDDDRRRLCDELEKATGRDWTAEEARRWSS